MKQKAITQTTSLKINTSYEAESIEQKVRRMLNNKEPIKQIDGSQMIYEERKDGINPNHDIRTDKWEYAVDETTNLAKSLTARKEHKNKMAEEAKKNMDIESKSQDNKDGSSGTAESTQATK